MQNCRLISVVKAHMWKELVEQTEIAEKSAKKFKPLVPKNKWGINNKERDTAQSSQSKEKIMAVELFRKTPPKQKRSNASDNQESKFPLKVYSFKNEQVVIIFHLLHKDNKLKLPEVWRPDEVRCPNDPNSAFFIR